MIFHSVLYVYQRVPLDDWLRYFGKSRDRESVTCSKHTETIPALLFQMLISIPRKIKHIDHTKPFNKYMFFNVFHSFITFYIILWYCLCVLGPLPLGPWPLATGPQVRERFAPSAGGSPVSPTFRRCDVTGGYRMGMDGGNYPLVNIQKTMENHHF